MRFPLALLAALAASCASVPEFRHDGTAGTVLADSPAVAANVAAALDELAPLVKARLASPNTDPITVHVMETDSLGACIYDDLDRIQLSHIEISHDLDTEKLRRYVLFHELVHWYGHDTWVANLPLYLEEGVADYLACESVDAVELRRVEKALPPGMTLSLTQLHSVTAPEWQKADAAQNDFLYRAGIHVVYHIGIPRLREAASAGPLSAADILQLLTTSPDTTHEDSHRADPPVRLSDPDGVSSRDAGADLALDLIRRVPGGAD